MVKPPPPTRPKISIILTLTLACVALSLIWGVGFYFMGTDSAQRVINEQGLFLKHVPAAIGLPSAAVLAFALVALLDRATGPLELNIFGMKLKGNAGEWFVWVVIFLVIIIGIEVLWGTAG